jgi:hypothetical protein
VKLHFATDAAELGIMEEIVEFPGILYAENVAEQEYEILFLTAYHLHVLSRLIYLLI